MGRIYLLAGSKADKAVIIDIDTQRVEARHVNIESKVELASVDEKRPRNVLLDDDWSLLGHILPLVYDAYTNAARRRRLTHTHRHRSLLLLLIIINRGVATGGVYRDIYPPKSVYLKFFMWLFCLLDPGQIRYPAIYIYPPKKIPRYASDNKL